ncbi:hypothetical protein B0H14DRAFT_2592077 [Mycena olivaceomarginata]|nr:hypothetical protein B0H14DRAFT_2592077 [Mycena olivaceomarginata]
MTFEERLEKRVVQRKTAEQKRRAAEMRSTEQQVAGPKHQDIRAKWVSADSTFDLQASDVPLMRAHQRAPAPNQMQITAFKALLSSASVKVPSQSYAHHLCVANYTISV